MTEKTDGRSMAGSGKAKRKPKPTSKAKNRQKKIKKRYSSAREEAQLAGVIPTTPDGAVHEERVPPCPDAALPEIVRRALRESWATPDSAKPAILAALLEPFFNELTVLDKDGNAVQIKPSPKMLVTLAQTIHALDKDQWQRDNPAAAGQAKGASKTVINTAVSVEANTLAVQVLRKMFEESDEYGAGATCIPGATNHQPDHPPRFDGDVEIGAVGTEGEDEE